MEIIELKDWKFKVRRSSKHGYYDVIKRRDGTFYCSCPGYMYTGHCKHIEALGAFLNARHNMGT